MKKFNFLIYKYMKNKKFFTIFLQVLKYAVTALLAYYEGSEHIVSNVLSCVV